MTRGVLGNYISLQRCAGDTHIIPQVKRAVSSWSFGGEIPAAVLFPSSALSMSTCVHSPSKVGAEERTPLRSSPRLGAQAPLTHNSHCKKYIDNNKSLPQVSLSPLVYWQILHLLRIYDAFFLNGMKKINKLLNHNLLCKSTLNLTTQHVICCLNRCRKGPFLQSNVQYDVGAVFKSVHLHT